MRTGRALIENYAEESRVARSESFPLPPAPPLLLQSAGVIIESSKFLPRDLDNKRIQALGRDPPELLVNCLKTGYFSSRFY